LTITLSSSVLAQNLVLNGGFETGDFSNWTQARDTDFTEVLSSASDPDAPSPEGAYHARFGPLDNGDIFQNFGTSVGTIYRVSYFLYTGTSSSTRRTFEARVGTPGSLITLETLTNPAIFAGYVQRSFTFTATSTTSRIRFTFQNDPDYWRLDDVFITRAVPEIDPSRSRLPLLILFCGVLLVWERRRSHGLRGIPGPGTLPSSGTGHRINL